MKNILIVDDNKLNLTAAKNVLSDIYKVTLVIKGEQALSFLSKNTCDLILLDINMPDMDGFEVLEKLRENEKFREIPVIFLTADNDAETETKCFRAGAVDYIVKPFVPEVMRTRIAHIIELQDLRMKLSEKIALKSHEEVSDNKNKSQKDALTGLWNKNYTEDTVNELLENGEKGSLFMIDLDNFKKINEVHGHIAGDNVLKMFSETLENYCGTEDIICRTGGDEFLIFIRSTDNRTELSNLAADIISDLCYKIEECKFETQSSISIGISQSPDDGKDFKELYTAADKALYYVKQTGKNSFHFYSENKVHIDEPASKSVDLNYLREIMSEVDCGKGAYLVDYSNFHHVYNFIRRFVERNNHDVATILFTATAAVPGEEPDVPETELALQLLEQAIFSSLRRVDVSTRYSSKQIVVILMDASTENGEPVAKRIIETFNKLYTGGKVAMEYGIAKLDKLEMK